MPETYYVKLIENLYPTEVEEIENYSHGRADFWTGGLKIFEDSPIYGHGQNTFPNLLLKKIGKSATAHNRYLLYLVQFGIIGLISYLFLNLSIIFFTLSSIKKTIIIKEKLLLVSYLSGLIGYLVALFFVDGSNTDFPFWFLTAAVCRLSQFIKNESEIN